MNLKSLFILGRQPALGRAELESLFGKDKLSLINSSCLASSLACTDIDFERLGGSIKLAKYLGKIDSPNSTVIQKGLLKFALECAQELDEGKIHLGLSFYGLEVGPKKVTQIGLSLKTTLRSHGYSLRLVPNNESFLSSAQVIHNHLVDSKGIELVVVFSGREILVGKTVKIQDIESYTKRDFERPKRDAFVGMLPPKLAQIIINLAASSMPNNIHNIVLDPFCGTGVILQEALLMGYGAYGTDIDPRMIEYTEKNIEWLDTRGENDHEIQLETGDSVVHKWHFPFSTIATEAYLGRPLKLWPDDNTLKSIVSNCDDIISEFLRNLALQSHPGKRFCVAIPAWFNPSSEKAIHLPLLDHLSELGYNRVSFSLASNRDLIYHRPDQLVGRELLVITRT